MTIAYGVDLGVYNIGQQGQMLATTRTAWCRIDELHGHLDALVFQGGPDGGAFRFDNDHQWQCGRSVVQLAEAIATDLGNHHRVAIGFEAAMWFPIYQQHVPGLQLFAPRFDAEQDRLWYVQPGPQATLKAMSIGHLMFSRLQQLGIVPANITTNANNEVGAGTILLFEAFVSGNGYRLNRPNGVPGAADNEWDAATAALAWLGTQGIAELPGAHGHPVMLHEAGHWDGHVFSVWNSILDRMGLGAAIEGPQDCEVVAVAEPDANG